MPGTLRVITARMDYLPRGTSPSWQAQAGARLAQPQQAVVSVYARGRDYHKVLRQRLQTLADWLQQAVGPLGHRVFTDSAPVLEAELATRSGIGWRGKHTLVLHRDAGSMFFLGEIFVDLALPLTPVLSGHCGACSACISACPTQAIVAPYQLDARRCISYLTIELDGPIPVEFRAAIGNRIYGCDDCQLACPWNKYAQRSALPDFDERHGLGQAGLLQLWAWDEADVSAPRPKAARSAASASAAGGATWPWRWAMPGARPAIWRWRRRCSRHCRARTRCWPSTSAGRWRSAACQRLEHQAAAAISTAVAGRRPACHHAGLDQRRMPPMQRRLFVLALAASPALSHAAEEPDYVVERLLGDSGNIEVRRYAAYTVAEVTVPGPADTAGNTAFPILAGYIFGGNQGARRMAMTAPVTQAPQAPQQMAMTTPVTQVAAGDSFVVQFVLPKGVTPETAPLPNDARIRIRLVPARRVAVVRYSGFWSEDNYRQHLAQLTEALRAASITGAGEPVLSRYDPPIMPWFLRRNEIWIDLA